MGHGIRRALNPEAVALKRKLTLLMLIPNRKGFARQILFYYLQSDWNFYCSLMTFFVAQLAGRALEKQSKSLACLVWIFKGEKNTVVGALL